ncbi:MULTISPECIES: Hpt domain-containing protein [unclassified Adlercreutzia]|uniref:Hpt domain-containing protein n=1 Tax=unclassified Adlercreutzia TaxID=2636013 RepID=UPI0013EC9970|nr:MULTISPECIES: Hpt domain-containing protein [unclassified Adlercreutzia]
MGIESKFAALGMDVAETTDRFCGNIDLLQSMMRLFAKESYEERLMSTFAERDWGELERAAHALKGSSANLGFVHLSSLAGVVVQTLRDEDYTGLDEKVDALVAEFVRVRDGIVALEG